MYLATCMNNPMTKNRLSVATLLWAALTLAVPLFAADNRELRIGVSNGPVNYNPIMMSNAADRLLYGFVGRMLIGPPVDGEREARLAVTMPTLENRLAVFFEEDGIRKLRAHWEIKEEAVWGDGTPVTARDVEFAWEVALTDTVVVPFREYFTPIERVEIDPEHPKKFALVFDDPNFQHSYLDRFFILPFHLEGSVFEERKSESGDYEKNTNYIRDPTNPGLYNGPYRIEEVRLGSHLILVPNENWYGKPPVIEKIILQVIPDAAALEANLMSGAIDMIQGGLNLDQAVALEKRIEANGWPYAVNFQPSNFYLRIVLQLQTNDILKSLKVRKALVYGADRDLLCESLFEGRIEKSIHTFSPTEPWYTDDPEKIVLYRHSKRTARKLLEEEGWLLGEDGYRYKDGERLSLEIIGVTGGNDPVLVFLQSEWKKVGIELIIKSEAARVFFAETVRRGQFSGMVIYSLMMGDEGPPSNLHSNAIPSVSNSYTGWNTGGWVNPRVDEIVDAINLEFDSEKRAELAHEFLYHYTNEVPEIPLFRGIATSVVPANLEGYKADSLFSGDQAEHWNLKN